jgi:uncharacterized protein (UPF0332 family)
MDAKLKFWNKKEKGLKLIEPNINLANEYLKSAEETLLSIKGYESNLWLATKKYYTEYFSLYALLMKIGIQSEIHDCTIDILRFLEDKKFIERGYADLLEEDKELRIDNQYYLKNREVKININELREFILKIKDIISKITLKEINDIRKEINKII